MFHDAHAPDAMPSLALAQTCSVPALAPPTYSVFAKSAAFTAIDTPAGSCTPLTRQ
jgi:hypothetical protein